MSASSKLFHTRQKNEPEESTEEAAAAGGGGLFNLMNITSWIIA